MNKIINNRIILKTMQFILVILCVQNRPFSHFLCDHLLYNFNFLAGKWSKAHFYFTFAFVNRWNNFSCSYFIIFLLVILLINKDIGHLIFFNNVLLIIHLEDICIFCKIIQFFYRAPFLIKKKRMRPFSKSFGIFYGWLTIKFSDK